jgi:hypothetical protein
VEKVFYVARFFSAYKKYSLQFVYRKYPKMMSLGAEMAGGKRRRRTSKKSLRRRGTKRRRKTSKKSRRKSRRRRR